MATFLKMTVAGEAETVTDPHGPEDYKRHLAGVLVKRALLAAYADATARGT